jgi:hypothetical protein
VSRDCPAKHSTIAAALKRHPLALAWHHVCGERGFQGGSSASKQARRDGGRAVTFLALMAAFYLAFYVVRGRHAALAVGLASLTWSVFGNFAS